MISLEQEPRVDLHAAVRRLGHIAIDDFVGTDLLAELHQVARAQGGIGLVAGLLEGHIDLALRHGVQLLGRVLVLDAAPHGIGRLDPKLPVTALERRDENARRIGIRRTAALLRLHGLSRQHDRGADEHKREQAGDRGRLALR